MNYKTGKVNFYTNYGQKSGDNSRVGQVKRIDKDAIQNFKNIEEKATHLLKFGVDFYLNEKNTLSAYTVQNKYDGINF